MLMVLLRLYTTLRTKPLASSPCHFHIFSATLKTQEWPEDDATKLPWFCLFLYYFNYEMCSSLGVHTQELA